VDANDAYGIDGAVDRLVRALAQSDRKPDDLGEMLNLAFAQMQQHDNGAGGISASRLAQVSRALGAASVPSGAKARPGAAAAFAVQDMLATALNLRLLKAFNRIEDAAVREGFVKLIEHAAKA
jgi:hypothetical protein